LLKFLKTESSWTVVDIGANIGQTLLKVKSINMEINYIGFEPNPVCVNYLYKLIAKNKLNNTILFPVGLSDKTQLVPFHYYTDSETDSSASIIPEYRPGSTLKKTTFVPVFDIRSIPQIMSMDKINLIKIDVEGAEQEVLLSCQELIKKHKPYIIIEILPVYSSENFIRKKRQDEIEDLVNLLNYKIYLIKKGFNESFAKLEVKETIGIHGNILDIDYLLVPGIVTFN